MADNIFTPEQQQQLAELMNGLYGITRETDPLIRAKIEEKKASDNAKEALKQLGKQLGNTAIDYSKAVLSAGEGFGKFGGTVTGATNAIGDWASKLGVAGTVIGGFIKIFGEIAAKSLKQNDDLMKSYQNLSDMGSVAAGGFETLRDQLHSVGLMAEEAEKFERVLKPITQQLAQFGGSVSQGREQLTNVISGLIGPNNEMEKYLARLGYSTQDIREGAADFVQRQSKLGLAQGKSQKQLVDESFRYMVTLKELQELTGLSRDEAQKELDAQMSDARMALHVSTLKKKEAQNLQDSMVAFKNKFGPELTAGLQDLVVNQGRITTEAAAAVTQIAPNAYSEIMKTLDGDSATRAQMLKNVASGIRTNVERLRPSIMIANEGLRDLGAYNKAIIGSMGMVSDNADKAATQLGEMTETGEKGSKRLNQNFDNEQKMRAMRIAGDKALYEVGDLTVGLFTKLNEVMFAFGKSTAKVVDWMNSFFGKKTNYSELFRDLDDNLKDINAQQDVKDKLLKDIELTKSLIASVEKDKDGLKDKIKSKEEEVSKLTKLYQDELKTGTDLNKRKELGEQVAESNRQLRELRSLKNLDNEKLILDRKNKLTKLEEELAQKEKKLLELDKERRKLDPSYKPEAADQYNLVEKLKQSGIVDPKAQANILAQIQAESGGKPKTESLKYTPEQLMKTFPGKFKDIDEAKAIAAKGEEAIGNRVYGGRMGNAPEEGFKYRGRGLIQLTGKENYEKYGKMLGVDLVKNPELANDPDLAQRIAVAYFKEKQKAGVNLAEPKQVSKAVGHVDIGGKESERREQLAQSILENLPKADIGGAFSGKKSGYPVLMHGNESIWPDDKLTEMFGQVQRTSLDQYKNELLSTLKTSKIEKESKISDILTGSKDTAQPQKLDVSDFTNKILSVFEAKQSKENKFLQFSDSISNMFSSQEKLKQEKTFDPSQQISDMLSSIENKIFNISDSGLNDVISSLGLLNDSAKKNTDLFAKVTSDLDGNDKNTKNLDIEWVVETMSRNAPNERLIESLKQAQQTSLTEYQTSMMDALGLKSKNLDLANENIIQNMPDMKGIVDALKQELPKLVETTTPATSTADNIVAEVMSVLSDKLDALIEEHRKTNDIQDQILTYTRA